LLIKTSLQKRKRLSCIQKKQGVSAKARNWWATAQQSGFNTVVLAGIIENAGVMNDSGCIQRS
jgi:hypothetical protein